MTSRDFCFWLQGYFELTIGDNTVELTPEQVLLIKKHLQLAFHQIALKEQPTQVAKIDSELARAIALGPELKYC